MADTNNNFNILVIIPTAGSSKYLKETLQSIHRCQKPLNFRGTFIVENGEDRGIRKIIDEFDKDYFRYVHSGEEGKCSALNSVIRNYLNDDDLLVFADDDVIVNDLWIENYNISAKVHGKCHFYGGSFDVLYEKAPNPHLRNLFPLSARGLSDDAWGERKVFLGFNWAAFRSDIERAGFFDEIIGPGSPADSTGDETMIQRKMLSMGCKSVFIRNNSVTHFVPEEKSTVQWVCKRAVRTGAEYAYGHRGGINREIYKLFRISIKILRYFLRGNTDQINKYLHSLIKASTKILILLNRDDPQKVDSSL